MSRHSPGRSGSIRRVTHPTAPNLTWRGPACAGAAPEQAFTLLELLLVLGVIGILLSLLLPSLARTREKAGTTRCLSQLRQLGLAMALYVDEHGGRLPEAHAEVAWTSRVPPPWTRPLLPYYGVTNLLTCPAYSRVHNRSPFSYFMGGRAAFVEASGQPASVRMTRILYPSQYLLSGDCNFPFPASDADPDNYTNDTLFGTNLPAHQARVNLLFADQHVGTARNFDPRLMTYAYTTPGLAWDGWDF